MNKQLLTFIFSLLLIFTTLLAYWQVENHDFLFFDDESYVTENRYVQEGGWDNIIWAFTNMKSANWHPVTWLSHMLDSYLFGLNPKGHHLTNLFFHITNTLLLFFLFAYMTGCLTRSGFVAALFALHPLHVESVAWVAERKDVLSTSFWFLTLLSYIYYVKNRNIKRYLLLLIPFVLGLMSKPMLVTLPFVLLLIDYWPLDRLKVKNHISLSYLHKQRKRFSSDIKPFLHVFYEKIPLFILSIIIGSLTIVAQDKGGAIRTLEDFPLSTRFSNAFLAYGGYIKKMLWPYHLAPYYPYPKSFSILEVVSVILLLLIISYLFLNKSRTHPYLSVGWLWFIGTLLPVIGFVQVGWQAMADRYTYIPLVGLFIIISWGSPELLRGFKYQRKFLSIIATMILTLLFMLTWFQVKHWKDTVTLFEHTIKVTKDNEFAYTNLGHAFYKRKNLEKAIQLYSSTLSLNPRNVGAKVALGFVLTETGKLDEAQRHLSEAMKFDPKFVQTHYSFGVYYAKKGLINDAIKSYNEALKIDPEYAPAINDIGNILKNKGLLNQAIEKYKEAAEIQPFNSVIRNNLGIAYLENEEFDKAIFEFKEAIAIDPENVDAHNNLGSTFYYSGLFDEAISEFKKVLERAPNDKSTHISLGMVYLKKGMISLAKNQYQKALFIDSDYKEAIEGLNKIEKYLKK